MITDAALAQLALAAYEYDGPFAWDWHATVNGVMGGIKIVGDDQVVILRGSLTLQDWARDFRALPDRTNHPVFGPVHYGFFEGLDDFATALAPNLSALRSTVITGHSLGAGRAPLLAALLLLRSTPVHRLVGFAPPRPGEAPLAAYLTNLDKTLYRNQCPDGHDYVTDVPFDIPDFAPFCHVGPLTDVAAPPPVADGWLPFRFHHAALYAQGVAALELAAAAPH